MDITQIRNEKWELDRKIEEILENFSKTTTMRITSIKIEDDPKNYRAGYKVFVNVEF